jgi:hypothetical protein
MTGTKITNRMLPAITRRVIDLLLTGFKCGYAYYHNYCYNKYDRKILSRCQNNHRRGRHVI